MCYWEPAVLHVGIVTYFECTNGDHWIKHPSPQYWTFAGPNLQVGSRLLCPEQFDSGILGGQHRFEIPPLCWWESFRRQICRGNKIYWKQWLLLWRFSNYGRFNGSFKEFLITTTAISRADISHGSDLLWIESWNFSTTTVVTQLLTPQNLNCNTYESLSAPAYKTAPWSVQLLKTYSS